MWILIRPRMPSNNKEKKEGKRRKSPLKQPVMDKEDWIPSLSNLLDGAEGPVLLTLFILHSPFSTVRTVAGQQ